MSVYITLTASRGENYLCILFFLDKLALLVGYPTAFSPLPHCKKGGFVWVLLIPHSVKLASL